MEGRRRVSFYTYITHPDAEVVRCAITYLSPKAPLGQVSGAVLKVRAQILDAMSLTESVNVKNDDGGMDYFRNYRAESHEDLIIQSKDYESDECVFENSLHLKLGIDLHSRKDWIAIRGLMLEPIEDGKFRRMGNCFLPLHHSPCFLIELLLPNFLPHLGPYYGVNLVWERRPRLNSPSLTPPPQNRSSF